MNSPNHVSHHLTPPVAVDGFRWWPLLALVCLVIALLFPMLEKNPSHQNMAILMLMAAQLGVAWNILGGYAGQV